MLNEHEDGGHILNCICDLTQFIVSCILIDTRAEILSKFFYRICGIDIRHGCHGGCRRR